MKYLKILSRIFIPLLCAFLLATTFTFSGVVLSKPVRAATIPGGVWVTKDTSFLKGGIYKIVVRGYPTYTGDPQISYVNVTALWGGNWHILCHITNDSPDLGDYYYCLTGFLVDGSFPSDGNITLSFDVYDVAGNVNYAPNGEYTAVFSSGVTPTPNPNQQQVNIDQTRGQATTDNVTGTIRGLVKQFGDTVSCAVFSAQVVLSVVGPWVPPNLGGPIAIPPPMPGPTTCAVLLNLING